MTVEQLLARARGASGRGIRYKLGAGGFFPHLPSPASHDGFCDCSGFVSWTLGVSRKTDHPMYVRYNGGWINTDAIYHDGAESQTGFFMPLPQPEVGCVVVYGRKPPRRKVGHVAIVSGITAGRATAVIHCSKGNERWSGRDAILETPSTVFDRVQERLFAWYVGIE